MAFEQRDNNGAVFKNTRKEKPTHPDMTGSAMVKGYEYWVSGWTKTDKNQNKFMSLAFKLKEDAPPSQGESAPYADDSDNLPF